jgi:hypothetical protein
MGKNVSAAGLVHVQPYHLPADGALSHKRMQPPPAEQFDEFNRPYGKVVHSPLSHSRPARLPATAWVCVQKLIVAANSAKSVES